MKLFFKNLAIVVISVLLTIVLFAAVVFNVALFTLTNPDFYKSCAEEAQKRYGFADDILQTSVQGFVLEGTLSGLNENVFADLITKENISSLINERIDNIISGAEMPTVIGIQSELRTRVHEATQLATDEDIDKFVSVMGEVIAGCVEISFMKELYPTLFGVLSSISVWIETGLFLLIVGFFVALWFLADGRKSERLKWLLYPIAAAGIMMVVLSVLTWMLNDEAVFNFSTQTLRSYLTVMKSTYALKFLVSGICMIVISAAGFVLPAIIKRKGRIK